MASSWGMPTSPWSQPYSGWPGYGWTPPSPAAPPTHSEPAKDPPKDTAKDPPKPDPTAGLLSINQDADDPTKWRNEGLRPGVDYRSWKECRDAVYGRIDRTMQYLFQMQPQWVTTLFGDEPGLTLPKTPLPDKLNSFLFNPLATTAAEMTWHGVDMLTPQDVDEAMKDERLSASEPCKKGYIENALGMNADVYAPLRGARRNRKV